MNKLYTSCKYRSPNNFEILHSWKLDNSIYQLHGKSKGNKNSENHTFINLKVYYGILCIIKKTEDVLISLDINECEDWYNKTFDNYIPDKICDNLREPIKEEKELEEESYD